MSNIKWARSVAGCTVGGLLLTACGGGGEDDGVVEIDFYYPISVGGPLESTIEGFVEDFHDQHEDIRVTPVYSGDYEQNLASVQSAVQASNPPALTVLLSTDLLTLHEQQIITPVGEIVDDPEWFDSFYDAFAENSVLPDGTFGSVPFQRSTVVMYWNKELFEEAGLDPETPPETWDEMVEFGHQLMEDGGAQWGVQLPSTGIQAGWLFEAVAIQNDSLLWDPETGTEVFFDAPGSVTALENWLTLQEDGLEPEGTVNWGNLPTEFATGNTGIIWTTTGQLTNIRDQADFDFGVAPLPAQERAGSPTGGGNLYVMNGISEEEQQAAVELARFLSSPEVQAEWTVASGYVATTDEAWELEPLVSYAEEFPQATVAREQLPLAEPELGTFRRQEIIDILANSVQAVFNGAEVQGTLEEAQEQADEILEEYR